MSKPIIKDLTALVLTYNGQRKLDECLKSLSFCEKIIVVDSLSTDNTKEIALINGAIFIENKWQGAAKQFEFAFKQVDTNFILSLDQDEICSNELYQSIVKNFTRLHDDLTAFYLPRATWYFDRFLKHSGTYPDYLLRLFKLDKLKVEVSGAHYSFHPLGATAKLQGDILHYPYEDFFEQVEKVNRYASEGAQDISKKGKKNNLWIAILHSKMRFLKLYIIKLGFLDGKAGYINAKHGEFYAFSKYIRIK